MTTLTRRDKIDLAMMLSLTFSTGVIDAVGYLGLDRVFTGNMTGNVVILGMALTGANGLPVLGPVVALGAFMLGAAIGGRCVRRQGKGWNGTSAVLLVVVGVLMVALATTLLVVGDQPPSHVAIPVTGGLGLVMGMQAATARKIGVTDVTTVVVTSTITGLAADSWLGGNHKKTWFRRCAAVVLIGSGAAVGALLLMIHIGLGVALSAFITLLVALVGHLAHRRASVAETIVSVG
ncbi:MAG: YoaK family protein [Propionibacteriaceae bacterium]